MHILTRRIVVISAVTIVITALFVREHLRVVSLEKQIAILENLHKANRLDGEPGKLESTPAPAVRSTTELHDPAALDIIHHNAAVESTLENWLGRIDQLKAWIEQKPELQTPEMKLLVNEDWLFWTYKNPLSTEADFQRAYGMLKVAGESHRNTIIVNALELYQKQSGVKPTDVRQLVPFLAVPLDESILNRCEFAGEGKFYFNSRK